MRKLHWKEFSWDDFKNKDIIVHLETKEEADDFCREVRENLIKCVDEVILNSSFWHFYKNKTYCEFYDDTRFLYASIDEYTFGDNYKVLEWGEYMKGVNEMKKEFKKSDLRTGMIIEIRDGGKYIVLKDIYTDEYKGDILFNNHYGWLQLDNYYDDNLLVIEKEYINFKSVDIMKIYKPLNPYCFEDDYFESENLDLIWEREEKKKMTIEEIEEELGYSIEIV